LGAVSVMGDGPGLGVGKTKGSTTKWQILLDDKKMT